MPKNTEPVYYADYLQLDKVLGAQKLESAKYGEPAHDETLFIIIHQVYELWFKEILHELASMTSVLQGDSVAEREVGLCTGRIRRINTIFQKLVAEIDILETMRPIDFLDFRDYLTPASGFQSVQFRLIEAGLGLKREWRGIMDQQTFVERLREADQKQIYAAEEKEGLLQLVDKWLARMPFLDHPDFNFWDQYQQAVIQMFDQDRKTIQALKHHSDEEKQTELKNLEETQANILALFNEAHLDEMRKRGKVRISQRALLAALFIRLYQEEPLLRGPAGLLMALVDLDETMTRWRNRHAMLAHRMLGTKIGTGGSSGHHYLKAAAERNRVFTDFFNLSSFLIPRSKRPELPRSLRKDLAFVFEGV